MTQTLTITGTDGTRTRRRRIRRAATVAVAIVAGIVVWGVCVLLPGLTLTVDVGASAQIVSLGSVTIVSLIAGSAAWALLALLEHRSKHGRRAWLITAWAVLAVSLLGPVSMGATGAVIASLIVMHLSVGIILIAGLARIAPRASRVH
ncbi:MAG: DUF6069 family protein [Microbacteriaceae bacterium]